MAAVAARWDEWKAEMDRRRAAVARLAERFGAVLVPTQAAFEDAGARAGPEAWLCDGIHPMPAGHELLARAWIGAVGRT